VKSNDPIIRSCKENDWKNVLKASLRRGDEVDLVNFNGDYDADYCRELAPKYSMIFDWKPGNDEGKAGNDYGFFRKTSLR
jgi:hypothetical protein